MRKRKSLIRRRVTLKVTQLDSNSQCHLFNRKTQELRR